jgi:short-subunit dehydrogenase
VTSYAGQVVIITGAAAGIGRQLALEFARRGASVGAIDLAEESLKRLQEDWRQSNATGRLSSVVCDVTQRDAVHSAVNQLESDLGPTDIMIANAGIGDENPIVGFSAEVFSRQISVNLLGVANTLEPILPRFIARRRGHIVAISSLASCRGLPLMAGYCASKAGVSSFMDSLRVELQNYGIHCTTICPGFIRTAMTKHLGVPTPGMMSLEHAVCRMVRAIERKQRYVAFPFPNRFLLTLNSILPTAWGDYLTMKVMGKALKNRAAR